MPRLGQHQDKLERLIDHALREQPLRHAPLGLESRILAEIERRTALPWYRKSFGHWPLAARVGFLVASYGFVRIALLMVMAVTEAAGPGRFAADLSPSITWLHSAASILSTIGATGAFVIGAIPTSWLYGGIAFGVALYGALFGLGAIAYRALYINK
jgi:hypothetical protein